MGDPECQTILPKLKNEFMTSLACCNEELDRVKIEWFDKKAYALSCVQVILKI